MHKPIVALSITVILWSSGFVAIRIGLNGYDPGSLALLRYLVSSLGIIIPFIFLAKPSQISFIDLLKCLLIGVVGFGVYNVALNYGETTVDAGITSFINSQIPVTVLILAIFFLREKVSLYVLTGITISCLGVSFIAYGYSQHTQWQLGILYLLVANVSAAIYTVFCKPLLCKYHPLEITAYTTWGGTLLLLFYSPTLWEQIHIAPTMATAAAIYLGIVPGVLGYLTWNYALKHLQAVRASSYLYTMPLIATFMGWCCLDEFPSTFALIGGFIALFGAMVKDKQNFSGIKL